jgi:hypothetical protein
MSESEVDKLFKWHAKRLDKLNTKFYVTLDKLQKECKHEITHWMQELDRSGCPKAGLFKRCFVCGATVEKLDASDEAIEVAMKAFDGATELLKATLDNKEITEGNKE